MSEPLKGWRDLKEADYLSSFQSWDRDDPRKVNEGDFPGGAFIPEVARFFIERHATTDSYIWDPMSGTGTTGLVAEGYGIPSLMTDLTPRKPCILQANAIDVFVAKIEDRVTDWDVENLPETVSSQGYYAAPYSGKGFVEGGAGREGLERMLFDMIVWHPPYSNAILYSDKLSDLSNVQESEDFLRMFFKAADNILKHLAVGGFLCLVIGDVWENGGVIPLGFMTAYGIETHCPGEWKVKGIAVKDIKGNRQNHGYHLRLSRLAKWGALDFKHEYLFSIQKKG